MNDTYILNDVINQIINNFDFTYMLSINILTYTIIKIIDECNGDKIVKPIYKKLILLLSSIILFTLNITLTDINYNVLINSTIAAPVFWSWVVKPILNKYNLNYKNK
jgi:hypothetical protein